MSGLRTQSGASRHVGGANRTIIKLAQQLLINPQTKLASQDVGALVRLDHVYDLVEGNISSDIRAKIASIPSKVDHPKAQAVAKSGLPSPVREERGRSAENVAACLHDFLSRRFPASRRSRPPSPNSIKASLIREADDGYRIPTPAEDDWNQTRFSISPRPADENTLYADVLKGFWSPTPTFSLGDTKSFRAGLMFNGKEEVAGDITFNVQFADDATSAAVLAEQLRVRSQKDSKSIFWVVTIDEDIRNETAGGLSLPADDRPQEPRRVDFGRDGAHGRRERPVTAAPWTNLGDG